MRRFTDFCIFIILMLVIVSCTREKETPEEAPKGGVISGVLTETNLLATITDDEKPQSVAAVMGHVMQPASFQVIFSESGGGVAYLAEKSDKVYVIHNDRRGRQYETIGAVALSHDGRRVAYSAMIDGKWRMVVDGREGSYFNAVSSPMFDESGRHVAYKALLDEKWFIVVDDKINSGSMTSYAELIFNYDSSLIAYVENADEKSNGRLVISDLVFKRQTILNDVGSPMITNKDRTRIAAVSREKGKQRAIVLSFDNPENIKKGSLYDVIHKLAFGPDGVSLSYDAERGGEHFLVLNDREDRIPKRTLIGPPVIRPDLKGVGAIIADIDPASQHIAVTSTDNARLHQSFINDSRKVKGYEEAAGLVYNRDGSSYAYVARTGQDWFVVVNGREGPAFDRVVTPVFSPDGKRLVYRARKDGKRFVVIADTKGRTIKQHPAYEQVFQPVFTADGKSVAYGVKDGQKLIWKVERL